MSRLILAALILCFLDGALRAQEASIVIEDVPSAVQRVEPLPPPPPDPPGGSATDALTGADLFHGNYCGRGHRLGALEPVDELDAACRRHDECYDRTGRRSCSCDRELRREALAVANNPRFSPEIRRRAGVVTQAAELLSCEDP